MRPREPRRARLVIVGALVAAGAVVLWALPLQSSATWLAEYIRAAGTTGVILFVAAYVMSTVAMIPGSILTLIAGFAYGPAWGLLLVSPTSVAAASAAFLLGRYAFHAWARRLIRRTPRLEAIVAAVEGEGMKLVILLRLSPLVPFNILNYTLSLTRIRFRDYVVGSFVGMLPATALYVYVGSLAATAAALAADRDMEMSPARIALYVLGLAATLVAVVVTGRAARKATQGLERT